MLQWMTRTALELVGQGGLGYSFDSLSDTQESVNPYVNSIKNLMSVPTYLSILKLQPTDHLINPIFRPTLFSMSISRQFLPWAVKLGPPNFRKFLVDIVPWEKLHQVRDMVKLINKTSAEVLEAKKRALQQGDQAVLEQIGQGKDIISILCMSADLYAAEYILIFADL